MFYRQSIASSSLTKGKSRYFLYGDFREADEAHATGFPVLCLFLFFALKEKRIRSAAAAGFS